MTNIVIVGAGFGGLQTALNLEKKLKNSKNIQLTLIDKREYHLFTPNLYEAATAEEELVSIEQIKKSITLPIRQIIAGRKIKFVQGRVTEVQTQTKRLVLEGKQINYDYLILGLGSVSDFFGTPGADKFALTLKDLPDALRIRNKIAFAFEGQRLDRNKKNLRLIVAGGGYSGLEFLGELKGLADFLSWENQIPKEKIEIEVIEAANKLVAGFDDRLSRDAYQRLINLGVRVSLASRISKVDEHFVELASGDKIVYDVLVWTAGIKASKIKFDRPIELDRRERICVNQFLQTKTYENIFALGDMAAILDSSGQPMFAPATAQDAWHQAKFVASALFYILKNQKPPKAYKPQKHGFIVNIGGKWAVMSYLGFYTKGFLAYAIDKFAHLRYYMSIVGFWKALKWVIFEVEIYGRND